MAREPQRPAGRVIDGMVSASTGPDAMSCQEFMARFGGSCRTKHLLVLPTGRRELVAFSWQLLRGRIATVNRRTFALPAASGLPREFIRLHPWEAEYLFLIASRATRGILEIGRWLGGSTFLLACANPRVPIWSIDKAAKDDDGLRRLFREHGVGANVELLVGDSHAQPFPEISEYDVVFIDGDHTYAGCSADLEAHFAGLAPGGHVVLHDSYDGLWDVQQAALDFIDRHDVETIRSPYNIASHWQTSLGSMAHLRKPGKGTPPPSPPVAPEPPSARQRVPRPATTIRTSPDRRPKRRRAQVAAAVGAAVCLFTVFGVAPELLGDWPYNPWGKDSRAAHAHVHARA